MSDKRDNWGSWRVRCLERLVVAKFDTVVDGQVKVVQIDDTGNVRSHPMLLRDRRGPPKRILLSIIDGRWECPVQDISLVSLLNMASSVRRFVGAT